uniref:Solute carrier organic anion transporter family member n=1 Tax=Panagrolaimus davidi TaxID=227884 RepID=A0A914Q176_9BILA
MVEMQKLDKYVLAFFVVFMVTYFLESIGGFYMTTAVVSIEKQFQIPSKVSGTMVSAGDFGYIPTVVFVAYLGGKGNRAKWIGFGCILIALANILISSSNFLFDDKIVNTTALTSSIPHPESLRNPNCSIFTDILLYENDTIVGDFIQCDEGNHRARPLLLTSSFAYCNKEINAEKLEHNTRTCLNDQMAHIGPTALIFFGLFILGIGRTMPFSLGLPLVDDNVKKRNLPLYFAGMFLIRMVGPVVGFSMGTLLQKQYYKFDKPLGLTPVDPEWIGRWWLGFLLIGLILFFPSLLLFFFPKPKADSPLNLVDKHARKNSKGQAIMPKSFKSKVTDFSKTIYGVLKQPVYFGSMIGRICDVFAFKGFFVFLPKYIELQFGLPQYKINMYMGIIGVAGFAIGVLFGTLAMRFLKLEGRKAAGWVAICSAIAAILSFINAFVGCHSTLTTLGQNLDSKMSLTYPCMSTCGCEQMPMFPVCDKLGTVFYSPCHAGCPLPPTEIFKFINPNEGIQGNIFKNCSCVTSDDMEASRQFCSTQECEQKALLYFLFMALGGMIGGMGVTPGVLILLRSVPPMHRSISLGFNGFLVSLCATLPSPIFWGFLFDKFCIKWDQKCLDSKGSCAIYDAPNLRWWLHIVYGALRMLALLTDIFVVYHAKGLKLTDIREEEESEEEMKDLSKAKLKPLEGGLKDPFIKKGHKRIPSGGISSKISHKMDDEDDFQQHRPSVASNLLANELSQHMTPSSP